MGGYQWLRHPRAEPLLVAAALLGAMTAEDVFNEEDDRALVVRFRGGEGGWSDKVLGCAAPAPGAVALLGVAGMFGGRRRR